MRPLDPPSFGVSDTFDECLVSVTKPERIARLNGSVRGAVIAAEADLMAAGSHELHRAIPPEEEDSDIEGDLAWLYKKKLVGSIRYDELMGATKTGMCPYCGIARANTIDHCLPKAKYPHLAIVPLNLMPACRECNMDKGPAVGVGNLNLYFDRWAADFTWLLAKIPDPLKPEQLLFYVNLNCGMSQARELALLKYFENGNLDLRYATLGIDEFLTRVVSWRKHLEDHGLDSLRSMLADESETYAARRKNGWQAAAYSAWSSRATEIDWSRAAIQSELRI